MAKTTYAIMGATGHIGQFLVETLLNNGDRVHAIGRDKNKLQSLNKKGAEIFSVASFDDSTALTKAFAGCEAVFSFIPPNYQEANFEIYQDKVGEAIKEAVINNGISFVLNLSSIGAHLEQGTGPIKGLHRHEQRLNAIPSLNVLHLRPGYFMENLNWSIPLLKKHGIIGTAVRSDLPIPMIAARDIGLKSAEFLQLLKFKGYTVFEFIGPKGVTMDEAAVAIGRAIGKPDLKYRQFSFQEVEKGMLEAGMKMNAAHLLLEMYKSINEEKLALTQNMTPEHLGKTTIDEFALNTFAPLILDLLRN